MKKEPANHGVVGTKKTGTVHHVKTVPKRVPADVEEKKRKTGGIMASAPPNMPLAVVVVEVQTSQNVKGKVGVESKVKKKSVTLKATSVPVKKLRSPSPKKTTTEESKAKQAKPKKVIATPLKTSKLKAKKADIKKPPKAPKAKSDKLTKKQKLAQDKQQQTQQKKHSTPSESVQTSPITVVISEQDGNDKPVPVSISCKKTSPKSPVKKQCKTVGVKKSGVAAGKIGKRKNVVKKTVAKEIGKTFKSESEKKKDSEKSLESSSPDQVSSEKNETNQPSKKVISNKKTKSDDTAQCVSTPNLDLSPTTLIDKSKTTAKTVKFKGTDKPKAVKTKKNTKAHDEQNEDKLDDNAAKNDNDSTDVSSKAESKKKEKPVKIDKSKVATEKKSADSKECSKKEETKTKKSKPEPKSGSNQQQKVKAKGKVDTVGKMKKTVKVEVGNEKQLDEEKNKERSDHNDSSTSDELPLELIKRQQKGKPQSQSEKTEQVLKSSVAVKEEKIAFEEFVRIKEEVEDLYDFKSSDGDCKVKDEKEQLGKGAPEKKGIKSTKKDDTSEKVVKKKAVKKPLPVKPGAVKVGVRRKTAANTKTARVKANRKVSSDDGGKSDNQESSDDAKKNKKLKKTSSKSGSDSEKRARRMKLFGFWSGPKKHRVASLNALAKVHCLYENESRGMEKAMMEMSETSSPAPKQPVAKASDAKGSKEKVENKTEKTEDSLATTRTLRSNPNLRSVGRHYDVMNASSTTSFTSSDDSSDGAEGTKKLQLQPSVKQKQQTRVKKQQEKQQQKAVAKPKIKPKQIVVSTDATSEEDDQKDKKTAAPASSSSSSSDNTDSSRKVKKRRKRNELMMDLKDMVVRKRMASLNASAILAASYSMEKRSSSSSNTRKDDSEEDSSRSSRTDRKRKSKTSSDSSPDMEVEDSSCEEDVLIRGGGSKQKVAVIVNQDTDLTITGVYVNSTTRSTHHEGFCSIAGMQYRISSTSHTQTEATAVATETVLHTDHPPSVREPAAVAQPGKSYTPLGALSSMQPPGHGHGHSRPRGGPPSPLARRPPHACSSTSAFSAPPAPPTQDPAYVHGYYQPAGPLISHHHHHHSTTTTSSSASVNQSKLPPAPSPPPSSSAPPATTSESSDQADSVVASGSQPQQPEAAPHQATVAYRYPPYHGYQYYPSPPASSLQYPPQPQSHYHQEICYSAPNPYPSPYFPPSAHKSSPYPPPPPTYHHRRYVPPQYYSHQEFYSATPPSQPPPPPQQQMIVPPAPPTSSAPPSSYPPSAPPPGGSDPGYPPPPPPPAPMVDGYHPPPPTYPYPAYSTGPPPPCYSHSPPNRLTFIDGPTYQGCPCPMQSCPKNVYTGPLTGASKGSLKNHQSTPLPPVALALPLEPPGAVGPPSPARGSAGMPPPPSPALATARNPNPPTQWSESPPPDSKSLETGLLVISKVVTDSVLGIPDSETNCAAETLIALKESSILMPKVTDVKIEVDDNAAMMSTYTQQEIAAAVDLKTMATNSRKRRRLNGSVIEVRRLSAESVNVPENLQKTRPLAEVQERLVPCDVIQTSIKEVAPTNLMESKDDVENRLPTPPPTSALPTVSRKQQHHPVTTSTKRKVTDAGCELLPTTSNPVVNSSSSKCNAKKRRADCVPVKETKKKCTNVNINNNKVIDKQEVVESETVEPVSVDVKAKRRNSKVAERRKSSSADRVTATATVKVEPAVVPTDACDDVHVSQPKKICRGRKSLEKSTVLKPAAPLKGKNVPKNNATAKGTKKDTSPCRSTAKKHQIASNGVSSTVDVIPEPEQIVCNPKKTQPVLKWSNGWSWDGTPFKSKVFLTSDDVPVFRKCYPSMRHKGGDIISPRDCVLLKSGKSKQDLPFVAKVAALWENPEDGEMMMSLLWYYRPEHTEHGRRPEDNVDEIFASRHKDINSVACIEDKCFVLTFNEYCRYRKSVRRCEEGLTSASRVVPMLDGPSYPRHNRQPPGQVASDMVFFCRRVYDFRQRRLLKNPS